MLLAASRTRGDEATDFWDVLRTVILEYLSTRMSSYVDWVVDRDESARDVVAALRRLPVHEQVLRCLHDEDGHTSRHEEGRFRAADLALLYGVEPASIRTGRAAINNELDAVRAPVAVGVESGPVAAHQPRDALVQARRIRSARARRRHLARPAVDGAGGAGDQEATVAGRGGRHGGGGDRRRPGRHRRRRR